MMEDTIVKNAVHCTICYRGAGTPAGADLINGAYYRCQNNSNHRGDTWVGIFTDLSYPKEREIE